MLSWATVRGYRIGENPARWRGHLDHLLPAKSKVRKVEHHAALPYADVGQFMHDLRQQVGLGARALEFLILTATRAGEVLNATWDEFDLDARTWVIPASRMKGGREHRVPLSDAAVAVLKAAQEIRQGDYVFPGAKAARPLSLMSLKTTLERMGQSVTSHGFRSTFRDWAAEQTSYAKRGRRDGAGPCGRHASRARLPSRRLVRQAPPSDGRLGGVLRGADRDQQRGRADRKAPEMKGRHGFQTPEPPDINRMLQPRERTGGPIKEELLADLEGADEPLSRGKTPRHQPTPRMA